MPLRHEASLLCTPLPLWICVITLGKHSDLPNNRAANLIIFGGKNTYTTLLGPTRLLISEIFPSKPDFTLHKLEKILPTRTY